MRFDVDSMLPGAQVRTLLSPFASRLVTEDEDLHDLFRNSAVKILGLCVRLMGSRKKSIP